MKNSGNCRVGPSGELVSDEFADKDETTGVVEEMVLVNRGTRRDSNEHFSGEGRETDDRTENVAERKERASGRGTLTAMFHILPTITKEVIPLPSFSFFFSFFALYLFLSLSLSLRTARFLRFFPNFFL